MQKYDPACSLVTLVISSWDIVIEIGWTSVPTGSKLRLNCHKKNGTGDPATQAKTVEAPSGSSMESGVMMTALGSRGGVGVSGVAGVLLGVGETPRLGIGTAVVVISSRLGQKEKLKSACTDSGIN